MTSAVAVERKEIDRQITKAIREYNGLQRKIIYLKKRKHTLVSVPPHTKDSDGEPAKTGT